MLVAVQLSVLGSYLPPVLNPRFERSRPPHTIIWLPLQTAPVWLRPSGALVMLVAVQLSVVGWYHPPLLMKVLPPMLNPPQTIISVPVQTSECRLRPSGALVMLVAVQLSVLGLYLPPVFTCTFTLASPPQTIISLPVQTLGTRYRPGGALVSVVAVHVSSMQLPEGAAIAGSVYVRW